VAVGGRVEVDLDEAALYQLLDAPDGAVARWMQRKVVEPITQEAKRRAPVSKAGSEALLATFEDDGAMSLQVVRRRSGYLRSHIGWRHGSDEEGMYWDIESPARSFEGAPYGLFMEVGTKPHGIDSHGSWPLRNRRTGQVFGRHVNHPGTAPRPYLRPALDQVLFGLWR
jgi:hypothetical protein